MRNNISAFTTPGTHYPSYFSANTDFSDPNKIELTVRSAAKEDGTCGDTSCISLDAATFKKIAKELSHFADTLEQHNG